MSLTKMACYTVSQLNQLVHQLLKNTFSLLWVEGEVSNFSCPHSGHWYFSLKDASSQVRCAMFQSQNRHLGFQLENGLHVLVRARIGLYEPRGDYQLIIEHIEPAGDGALRLAFEQLKNRLLAEGLFDKRHKKPLPTFPQSLGVITSPSGAVIRDILSILKRRFPAIPIVVYPTAVQGEQAASQIVEMLKVANQRKDCDVLILARGGGSLEDLAAFNTEQVARAVFASKIPLVSAIGHETDFTMADFVADVRAPTPSAAAELISPDWIDCLQHVERLMHRLTQLTAHFFEKHTQHLAHLSKRLFLSHQQSNQAQRLDYLEQRLQRAMQNQLRHQQQQFIMLARALETVSPLAILARGYSITLLEKNKVLVRQSDVAQVGDTIVTQLETGKLFSVVTHREP